MNELPALPPPAEPPPPELPPRRRPLLPWLTGAGFLVVAAALFWVWRHPSLPTPSTEPAGHLTQQISALQERVARLEQRPQPSAPDLGPLTAKVTALEQRPVPDPAPLAARVAALEQQRAPSAPAAAPDLAPLVARITALEQRPQPDISGLAARVAALEAKQQTDSQLPARVDALGASVNHRLDAEDKAVAHLARVQAAWLALDAGENLGDMPGAPPALARFAQANPPTLAALRLGFPEAAQKALSASRPATAKSLWARLRAQAQDLVTIREGDRVVLGDPIAIAVEHARASLDAGDLAASVAALATLQGPAADAMANWLDQARVLLEARAALVAWAAHN